MSRERNLWETYEDGASTEKGKWEIPLAERMRPQKLDGFLGQPHLTGPDSHLAKLLRSGKVPSCILYGPPGVGKTTLARIMASETGREFLEVNAVTANVASLRSLVEEASRLKKQSGHAAVVFVDEIYHFNRQQQNVLLPSVEKGDLILTGTTTETPWFEINKTLLSRMMVFELHPLDADSIVLLLEKALADSEKGVADLGVGASREVLEEIAHFSGGDARQALFRLEAGVLSVAASGGDFLDSEQVRGQTRTAVQRYDRDQDEHYRTISALIKSMRGSDPDASVYWLARLIAGGEDLRFIARRLLIFASEDVGLADPGALTLAASAAYAADMVGLPEARIILSEAVIYLSSAPKSNSAYLAVDKALSAIDGGDLQEVPPHLDPHGAGYRYPHHSPEHWVPQQYLRENRRFYYPGSLGMEKNMARRLARFWKRFRQGDKGE
ncbi:MAG: replication-associated recombination protein A [Thermovirgaceae bacterium]